MEPFDVAPFSQEYLYKDNTDLIMHFLCMDSSEIVPDIAFDFRSILLQHLREVIESEEPPLLPSFGEGFDWVNTSRPLSFDEDLGKKIFIMDFFTYCCINCIHILPYLKEVEREYASNTGFAVIGIHSPKFPNEKNLNRVTEAILRNDIKHPVLNDPESKLWEMYGITCWPTVFIVGPDHTLLFVLLGEVQIEKLLFVCQCVFEYFESSAIQLDLSVLPVCQTVKPEPKETDLFFPGNVSTNGESIVVSDTGHNRLVIMTKNLAVEEVIGSGICGSSDGPFDSASFDFPHGTVWYNDDIYVADTGSHCIRKVDLKEKVVLTVFKSEWHTYAPDLNLAVPYRLLSPWDVCIGPKLDSDLTKLNVLYIAAAGSHQIWALDLEGDRTRPDFCVPFAGSGREENRPNLYKSKAGFAQPTGIAYSSLLPDHLFVADSESSTIKSIALKGGAVKNVVGGGLDPHDLFQFGDVDGNYKTAKLQHPMGVCVFKENMLAIVDTFNSKVKFISVKERESVTYRRDLKLNEPGGICCIDEMLFVADTNNHQIVPVPIEEFSEVDSVTFDCMIECYNFCPNDILELVLQYNGLLFCFFKFGESLRLELSGIQKWNVSNKGHGKWDIMPFDDKFFGVQQPSLILKPSCERNSCVHENLTSEITLTGSVSFCDKVLKVCCLKQVTFTIDVRFSDTGCKRACLKFISNIDYL